MHRRTFLLNYSNNAHQPTFPLVPHEVILEGFPHEERRKTMKQFRCQTDIARIYVFSASLSILPPGSLPVSSHHMHRVESGPIYRRVGRTGALLGD